MHRDPADYAAEAVGLILKVSCMALKHGQHLRSETYADCTVPGYYSHVHRIPGKSKTYEALGKHPGILGWLEQLAAFHDTRAPLNRLLNCMIE